MPGQLSSGKHSQVPHQNDSSSCGLFVCAFLEAYCNDIEPVQSRDFRFSQGEVKEYRERLVTVFHAQGVPPSGRTKQRWRQRFAQVNIDDLICMAAGLHQPRMACGCSFSSDGYPIVSPQAATLNPAVSLNAPVLALSLENKAEPDPSSFTGTARGVSTSPQVPHPVLPDLNSASSQTGAGKVEVLSKPDAMIHDWQNDSSLLSMSSLAISSSRRHAVHSSTRAVLDIRPFPMDLAAISCKSMTEEVIGTMPLVVPPVTRDDTAPPEPEPPGQSHVQLICHILMCWFRPDRYLSIL